MPSPVHRAPAGGARRLSRAGTALLTVLLLLPVAAAFATVRFSDDEPRAVVEQPPQVQRVVAGHSVLSVRRVVAGTEVDKIDLEALRREREARLREKAQRAAAKAAEAAANAPFSVRIGSFNVLGSQHTAPGGTRQNYPPASTRTAATANLVGKHGVDILGAQEMQSDQLRDLQNRTGMAAWPGFAWGEAETDNSVLYDPGVFEVVSGSSFTIPFMGRPRPQPIVRLRHLATGRELYVVNTHPSAGGGSYVAERRQGQAALVGVVNDLKSQGIPVLVTGDMNDREEFYCRVVAQAGLIAPNGGSYSAGCQPPPQPLPVDWVVGLGATWSEYWRDTTPVTQKISDHYFISARASIGD